MVKFHCTFVPEEQEAPCKEKKGTAKTCNFSLRGHGRKDVGSHKQTPERHRHRRHLQRSVLHVKISPHRKFTREGAIMLNAPPPMRKEESTQSFMHAHLCGGGCATQTVGSNTVQSLAGDYGGITTEDIRRVVHSCHEQWVLGSEGHLSRRGCAATISMPPPRRGRIQEVTGIL